MSDEQFARFTGLAEARRSLAAAREEQEFATAALVDEGKNAGVVRRALHEMGVRLVEEGEAEALVMGTLSPGPLLDAWERRVAAGEARLVAPWRGWVGECALASAGREGERERSG
jgi:hypothetical protein